MKRTEFPLFQADPAQPEDVACLYHLVPAFKHAAHYLGSTPDFPRRDKDHRAGTGARLLRAQMEAGGDFHLVRTWEGGRHKESELKSQSEKHYRPECNEHPAPGMNTVPRVRKTRHQRQAEKDARQARNWRYEKCRT